MPGEVPPGMTMERFKTLAGEHDMAFVNEYISPEDVEKYGIKAQDDFYIKAHYEPSWTRDRERDIYLRYMGRGREEFADEWTFVLYWRGRQIEAVLKVSGGAAGWRATTPLSAPAPAHPTQAVVAQ